MTIDVTPVLIVGGGIAGPATARMLRRSGLDARVVERAPAGGGAGVYLPAKSVRALGELGLAVGRRSGRRSVLGATRHLPHAASDGVHPLAAFDVLTRRTRSCGAAHGVHYARRWP